ncbi:Bud-site selection protein [Guyanagaster necrorhizus]|uniref:Bud-site selection protein n=1 Tax=Guyanagaster necrorhizus TaxID=856835 RepID=A0A9P7VNH7_9AGAR|nr:Bud-site selection protein [Guyanagaster necrorhizus MCA 3950]KAG7443084.1 Bud-site selection protein [Guyanagaster necrorhizus MCA 3950]
MAEKRGVKRKRNEAPKEKDLGVKIGGKLHHDLREVKKAAKKAKNFETQKLVKKLKTLRNRNEDHSQITECESELDELKGLNHEAVARTALRSKLLKDRILSGNEYVQAAMSDQLQSNLLGGSTKVQGRILSSKVLAVEIANIIEGLRAVILPPADEDVETSEPPRKMTKVEVKDGEGEDDDDDEEEVEAGDEMGWESGTVGDDEKENDDGWESGSLDEDGNVDEGDDDTEVPLAGPRAKPTGTKAQSKSSTGGSTFLPSLSVGFIKGNEDSDWSESDAKAGDIEQKKNRRGQRARRAIWEKKYGKNANHKKQEAMAAAIEPGRKRWSNSDGGPSNRRYDSRPSHGSAKDGKFKARDKGSEGQHHQRQDTGWEQRKAFTRDDSIVKPDDGKEALHPSWEAKRRLQAKQQMLTNHVQNRKIKFA